MRDDKQIVRLAKTFFQLSLEDDRVSPERVSSVLEYIEKNPPRHALKVLRLYARYIQSELDKSIARVEYAGDLSSSTVEEIGASLAKRLGRPLTVRSQPNPNLLAGVRVRVGCDLYENSVARQLAGLNGRSL